MHKLILVWDLNTFERYGKLEGHRDGVTSIWVMDLVLTSFSLDKSLRYWDLETRECLKKIDFSESFEVFITKKEYFL